MRNPWFRLLAVLLAFGLIAAACGDDDDGDAADDGNDDAVVEGEGLAAVCDDTIVIQTDWFPEAEYGGVYHLIGDDYDIDENNKTVGGSLVVNGEDTGIDVEIRAGGPAIGDQPVSTQMYTDDAITLGFGTTEGQILQADTAPMLSVIAPLEINPQIIYWDPETYPEIQTLEDLGDAGVTINVFGGGRFAQVFVAQGIWSADQIDESYDGSPARFVAEGDIAQQGFATAEPWTYKNEVEEYGRDVKYELLNDAGFTNYSQTLAIRPDDLETLRPCLTELVPLIQQSIVDYQANPAETNALIVETVEKYDTFWTYPAELAEFSVAQQSELGIAGNGPDDTVGNMEEDRVQNMIDLIRDAGMDVPEDLTPADIFTNEFIDDTIGF